MFGKGGGTFQISGNNRLNQNSIHD